MKRYFTLAVLFAAFIFATLPQKKITVHLAGDSTMADKQANKAPETGWGTAFKTLVNENATVVNYAQNGRSTKSFINEGRWQKLVDNVQEGDWVFIQFGHNDEKVDKPAVGTTLEEYKANLTRFVNDVRAKKGFPVLFTPVMRRSIQDGVFINSHGLYPDAVKEVAAQLNVPLVDMLSKSKVLLEKTGIEESKKFYLIGDSTAWANYPKGVTDNTHFQTQGAQAMAQLVVAAIKEQDLPLKAYLK